MKYLTLAIAITLSAVSTLAHASSINNARITHIIPNNAGIVVIYLDTARTGLPSCAGTNTVAFEIDATTPAGQAMLSGLYVAFASNLPIDFAGTGTCGAGGNTERIAYYAIHR